MSLECGRNKIISSGNENHYKDYLTTVSKKLEKLTGYDFLSDVPKQIQNVIETRKNREMIQESTVK